MLELSAMDELAAIFDKIQTTWNPKQLKFWENRPVGFRITFCAAGVTRDELRIIGRAYS
jgi:hypothetical protein